MFVPDGQWCDVTTMPDGRVGLVYSTASGFLYCLIFGEPEPSFHVDIRQHGAPWHYTRAAADGRGVIGVVAQADDGRAIIYIHSKPHFLDDGSITGTACCEVIGLPVGWYVWWLRAGTYERLTLDGEGKILRREVMATPTSQGFLSGSYGPLLADDGRYYYSPKDERLLTLPESVNGLVWFGQHPDDPPRYRAANAKGQTATILQVGGYGSPPHVTQAGDGTLVVCGWTPGGSWVEVFDPDTIPWGNDTAPAPTPIPAPQPPVPVPPVVPAPPAPSRMPVPTPDSELTQLAQRLETKYGSTIDVGGLARGETTTHVDVLGASRWRRDYFLHRDGGASPDEAWARVNRSINQIVGLPGDLDPNRPS